MNWTNRYQLEKTVSIRVWPKEELTFKMSMEKSEWSVDGMTMNRDEHMVVAHFVDKRNFASWEMSDADANRLACAGAAGASFDSMVIRTPGTPFNRAKMECWLEVKLTVNPKAWLRKEMKKGDPTMHGTEEEIEKQVRAVWENDVARYANWKVERYGYSARQRQEFIDEQPRRAFTGLYYLTNPALADLTVIAEEVMAGKAILVDRRLAGRLDIAEIDRALDDWTIPGVEPDAPGGEFNPLQLGRSVFWCADVSIPEWKRGDGKEAVRAYRKEARREKLRERVQQHYIMALTTRIATHYGVSRERVASRLLEEGFMEWMAEDSERIWDDPARAKYPSVVAKCQGPVERAYRIITFCIDAMAIRPPDPVPPLLTPKQQEARLEYRRKKIDAFNKLPKEEQEKVLAKKAHRERNHPEQILKRIVSAYAAEEGQTPDEAHEELTAAGILDLLVNGLKTRKEASSTKHLTDNRSLAFERVGPDVIRLLKRCHTGEAAAAWNEDCLVR